MKIFYSPDYVASGYSFDTTRKPRWVAESLIRKPMDGVQLVAPAPLKMEDLRRVHTAEYVTAIRTGYPYWLANSGLDWTAGTWKAVTASTSGVVEAAKHALQYGTVAGSLSCGLHHARGDAGLAFCTFNGLAAAVKALQAQQPKLRILVVDLDAHFGGGTYSIIGGDDNRAVQLDISTSEVDWYEVSNYDRRSTTDMIRDGSLYLSTLQFRLAALTPVKFDLIIYNAGMDPHQGCFVGGLKGITDNVLAKRDAMIFDYARNRRIGCAFVLAGGYVGEKLTRRHLVNLHRGTIRAGLASAVRKAA